MAKKKQNNKKGDNPIVNILMLSLWVIAIYYIIVEILPRILKSFLLL
jgi:hypothetical protein